MKEKILKAFAFFIAFTFFPLLSFIAKCKDADFIFSPSYTYNFSFSKNKSTSAPDFPAYYKVLDIKSEKIINLTPAQYIVGVVAAEMPASFETEALKAQAVASHTYALYQMGIILKNPDKTLKGAFISTDSSRFQAYLSKKERENLWGKNFESYEKKITDAVSCVINEILVYENEPIIAAFHSLSPGQTEASEDIWGKHLPYLISVESPYENNKISEKSFTKKETEEILGKNYNIKDFKILSRTDSGTVLKAFLGKTMTGSEIRKMFNLNSANFTIKAENDTLTFTTYGYGHLVGMSQYGANFMAQEGKNYKEILSHYYPETSLENYCNYPQNDV